MAHRRLTTAQAIVEFLKHQYIRRDGLEYRLINGVFGIFGHGNVAGIGQALEEFGGTELPYLQPKNEQAMVHIAAAYAKAKNRLGTFACTSSIGPGATNMVTAAAAATVDRLPVLLLPADIFADRIPDPVLQQLEYPMSMDISVNDCLRPVSRYWDRIQRPEQILRALPEAMRVLADPIETGAVTLSLPQDVQAEAFDFPLEFFSKKVYSIRRDCCSPESLKETVELIKTSKRPFIIAGGGVHYSEAERSLEALVDATRIPVGFTQAGMGSLPHDHQQSVGAVGVTGTYAANEIAKHADLVVAVGTRLSDFTTASKTQFQAEHVRFININVSSFDAHKHNAHPMVGDARIVLSQLTGWLRGWSGISNDYAKEVHAAKIIWEREYDTIIHPAKGAGECLHQSELIVILNEHAGKSTTVVHAAGGIPGDIHKLWRSKDKKDYHSEYGYSTMGYEIPGALGVKLTSPEREVIAFLGDGSYLMGHASEIVTSRQLGLGITIILADNHGYQCIHSLQKSCGSPGFGNEFREMREGRLDGDIISVDYLQNAKSLGAVVYLADTKEKLVQALRTSRDDKRTSFIYVPVQSTPLPGYSWWDVPVAEVSSMDSVIKARQEYDARAAGEKKIFRGGHGTAS